MQLVDELSMIYTACLMCYATFSFSKSTATRQILALGLASLAIFITLYYHYLQDPVFHQNAFAILTAVVLLRSMYVMEVNIRPSLKTKYATAPQKHTSPDSLTPQERKENARRDVAILKEMWLMVALGLGIFLGGFGIWALDIKYCGKVRAWRHKIGLPWGILLEGHGWWHLMTGIGSYFYIVWAIWLRHCLNERQDEYVLDWPSMFFSLPQVVPLQDAQKTKYRKAMNGNGNGLENGNGNGNGNGHAAAREDRKSV
jgi:dihydroceramidase